jgi:imidazolonepropionase-like amidohydrolase
MEVIISATAWGGEIMGHPEEPGKVLPGYYADVILIDGNPLEDIEIFQDTGRIHAFVVNGHIRKTISGNGQPERVIRPTTLPVDECQRFC